MNILLIDHVFHKKTHSSNFFTSLLRQFADVDVRYVDPEHPETVAELNVPDRIDLVALWQMDYLAPIFLARGLKTAVIPMYDGSSLMPDLHWLWARNARFVNFSRRLHDRTRRLGLSSRLVKYFMPPIAEASRARFDKLRVMLWQRRPEHGINLGLVEKILGQQIHSVHIHDAPDDPKVDTEPYCKQTLDSYHLSVSRWFAKRDDYYRLMQGCNVFVAPRRSEGIGMGLLEAMGRGMLVLAADAPTHDEYISNWLSGILFNPDDVGYANVTDGAASMGEMAWRAVKEGHASYKRSEPQIIEYILSTPRPPEMAQVGVRDFAIPLIRAYTSGLQAYRSYLFNNVALIERMTGLSLRNSVRPDSSYQPMDLQPGSASAAQSRQLAWLKSNRIDSKLLAAREYTLSGEVVDQDGVAWLVGQQLQIGFRLDPRLALTERLSISYRKADAIPSLQYCVVLNGWTLGMGETRDTSGQIDLPIPREVTALDNILQLQLAAPRSGPGTQSTRCIGLKTITFE